MEPLASGVFPLLNVADLDKSIEWYRRIGLRVVDEKEGDMRWGRIPSGEGSLILFPRDLPGADEGARAWATGDVGRGVLVNVGVPKAARLWEKVQAASVTVDDALQDQPWGGQAFTVVDPDGYVVCIADRFPGDVARRPAKKLAARTARRSAKKATKKTPKKRAGKKAAKRAATKRRR